MLLVFTPNAWEDYIYWQKTDKKLVNKINQIIKVITRTPYEGEGKPEPLKHELAGFWSRRINSEHRIIYKITETQIQIISCRFHYGK